MPLSPENAQKLTNLQQRILANAAADRPKHAGISKEELKEALDILRGDRAKALQAGVEKAKKGKKEKVVKIGSSGKSLDEILAARGKSLD